MAPSRAYVTSDLPLKGQSEVVVTNASLGPSKFSIRLKNSNWEYQRMRSELESTVLHSLPVSPNKGTPCIVVKSKKLYRGLVLSTNRDQNTFNICFVDFGCIEALPLNMLFQIPDKIMAYNLFSTSVALTNGEALSQKPGMDEIFASLLPRFDHLMCEVVNVESTHQRVNLYDVNRQSIAKVVLRMYNQLIPKVKALSTASPSIPIIQVPDPMLESTEKIFVTISHTVGHFYGQLVNRPTSELVDLCSELRNFYEANPKTARLDVESSINRIAVVKWSQDGQFYRCRILNVTGNDVKIELIDFGDVITVPRLDIFALVVSGRFIQPAFGINCVLSRDRKPALKKQDWDAALLEKTVEVGIVNKNPDGTYTVAFTSDPYNHKVLEELYPLTNPVYLPNKTAQLESKRSSIQPPSRGSVGILTESHCLNKPREDLNSEKLSIRQIFQNQNIEPSVPVEDPLTQRLLVSPVVQEILRTPCGLPYASSGSKQGFVRANSNALKTTSDGQMVDKATSLIPTFPVPTGTYSFLDTAHQCVAVASFFSFERFFLTPVNAATYQAKLEPLDEFYASLSANELVEDSPKVGLPCVVRSKEDGMFYRSQIVAILPDKTAQILFVDNGNEQLTPLTDIKRIVPEFMKLPQLVWPCKLAGIDGAQQRTDVILSADEELIATFLSIDMGVHLVKVVHKTHGDMATYLTKKSLLALRPAVSQLRDLKHELRPDGYDVFVSYVKSASEFWIQLKEDEQLVNSVGEELTQHVEKGACRVERPLVGQLYAMERPDVGGYYRARVSSCDGMIVQATFVDYGDAHPVLIEKVFPLPDGLRALPLLATRCSISCQKRPLEEENRIVTMTPTEGFRLVDSPAPDGTMLTVESATPLTQKINVPEPSPDVKKAFPRPAVADLFDPSILMQTKDHEIYISYSISPTEYWIQFKADEDLINKVEEVLVQHMERTPLKVECPVVGQIYAMEHPTIGGHYRGRVSSLNGDTVVACFVDYGDFVLVSIEKIFLLPAGLELLHPLAARCRSKRRYGSSESKKSFISITSDFEAVFRASFGPIISKSVREVEALFLNGKNIEKDIFPGSDKQKSESEAIKGTKRCRKRVRRLLESEEAFSRPAAVANLCDPSHKVNTNGYDVYVSYVDSPSDFCIQLKADEKLINKVFQNLMQKLEKANMPIVVDQLYAVKHPKIWGKFRARITSVQGATAEACFVDYGDVHPVPIKSIFVLPECLRLLPPLASRCRMERQEWSSVEKNQFILLTRDLDDVFRATLRAMDDDGVRRVDALFFGGKNIEDDIFLNLQSKENVEPARIEFLQPAAPPCLPMILEVVEPDQVQTQKTSPVLTSVRPDMAEAVDCLEVEILSLDEEISVHSIPSENLIVLEDSRQQLQGVEAARVIDLVTAPLEQFPHDHILVPIVQVLGEGSSTSVAIGKQSSFEEYQVLSVLFDDEPSKSDTLFNHSILTAETAPMGSVIEEQPAAPIAISDKPSTQIDLKLTTLLEEKQEADSILMDGKVEKASDSTELVPVEDAVTFDPVLGCTIPKERPETPVLTALEFVSDCFAASKPIVHEEETVSDPAVRDLIVYEEGVDNNRATPAQLAQEVATFTDGELNDPAETLILPHTDLVHSFGPEAEEEELIAFGLESTNNLNPQLAEDESTIDIIELVNSDGLEKEVPSGLKEVVGAPVQSFGSGTSDMEEKKVSNPEDLSPVLLKPLHFAVVAPEVELVGSASPVIEKEHENEPLAKEEQPIETIFEIDKKMMDPSFSSSFPTPDRSVLDYSLNLELFNLSMISNGDEETELHNEDFEKSDEELASTRDSEDATRSENEELELRAALAELS